MIRAPGFLADLDVPFMPRFSLYCYNGDGGPGGPGGDGGFGTGMDEDFADPAVTSVTGEVEVDQTLDAEEIAEVKAARAAHRASRAAHAAGTISSNPNPAEDPQTTPYGQAPTEAQQAAAEEAATIAAIQSDTEEPMGFLEALSMGHANAQARHGDVNTIGSLISGAAGLGSALANAPAGSMAHPQGEIATDVGSGEVASTSGEGVSVAAGSGEPDNAGEAGGPSEEELRDEYPETLVTPVPQVVDAASSDAVPDVTSTSTTTSAPAAEALAPTVTPSQATSAPGTLLRRRRRSRTILTSPQGVGGLGGEGSALRGTRRTRSLPRKTLLGG